MFNPRQYLRLLIPVSLLILIFGRQLSADDSDKSFTIRTNEPLFVGNTFLSPGTYEWKLVTPLSDRHVIQISNQRTHTLEATIIGLPKYRADPAEKNELQFWETPSGVPSAVRAWFYPGDNYGQEFPYPDKSAIALHTRLAVPAASQELTPFTGGSKPKKVDANVAVRHADKPQVGHQTAIWPEGSWAVVSNGAATAPRISAKAKASENIWQALKNLPLTATLAPLIGLIGLGSLVLFLLSFMKRKQRESAQS